MSKIAIFVTHPVQYHVPIWRALHQEPDLESVVFYFSDHSIRGGVDAGFGRSVAWDVPLLEGYRHVFLQREADLSHPQRVACRNAAELLRSGGFTHVLLHGYVHRFERQVLAAADELGLEVIMRGEFGDSGTQRPVWKRVVRDAFLRRFYRRVDRLCYIGAEARRHLLRFVDEDRLFFSPYSVDTEFFAEQRSNFSAGTSRRQLRIPDQAFVILFSGKLIERKDPLVLVDALKRLPPTSNAHLVFVGDGPMRAAVEERGAALGDRFHFHGFVNQSELGRYFQAADAFVLPSRFEAWGLVANEAMQFGLPVVLSDGVRCPEDRVGNRRTGMVFPAGDVSALANCLYVLENDAELTEEFGRNAERHIEKYSSHESVRGILQAIRAAEEVLVHG